MNTRIEPSSPAVTRRPLRTPRSSPYPALPARRVQPYLVQEWTRSFPRPRCWCRTTLVVEGSRRATIGIAVSVALVLATMAASTTASAAPAFRSPLCPKLCWVINTAGIYSIERHSHLGWERTGKRFANPRTYPIVQPNKVPPGSEDWDFYTTPPAHITNGGAHRMQQFWMFQALWMACPPDGLATGHAPPAPPPDINAFFFHLEPGG